METADDEFQIAKTVEDSESRYPPYLVDAAIAQQYGVGGSPTFVLNGKVVSVSRSAEAIKQAICSSFNEPPEECSVALSASAEAPSFGPIGSGSGSETDEIHCFNLFTGVQTSCLASPWKQLPVLPPLLGLHA